MGGWKRSLQPTPTSTSFRRSLLPTGASGAGWVRWEVRPFTSLSSHSPFHSPFYQLDYHFYCKIFPFQQLPAALGTGWWLFLSQGRLSSTGIQWLFPSPWSVWRNKVVPGVVSSGMKSSEEIACVLGWWSNPEDLTLFSVSKIPVNWNSFHQDCQHFVQNSWFRPWLK